jgi:hypothetical protein
MLAGADVRNLDDATGHAGLLVRPPRDELPELDIAITRGVGHFEIEQALGAGDIAIESFQQDMEFVLIDEAIAVQVAQIENLARLRNAGFGQRSHDRSSVSESN